jgi:glycosyltransferase involved in cell wall biosynthesis
MADYLGIDAGKIDVVYPGVSREVLSTNSLARPDRPPTIGYLARICPEKGLDRLIDAVAVLKRMPGMEQLRVRAAGYLGSRDRAWFAALQRRIAAEGLSGSFEYLGEVDLAGKLALLDSVDVLSVPTAYEEAKGIYVLEALARRVPVVQPRHGSFVELIAKTGGGVLVPPGDALALATALADVLRNPERREAMGRIGFEAVQSAFLDEHMAGGMMRIFREMIG